MATILFDQWGITGLGGCFLTIFSLFAGAELPEVTGASGLLLVAFAFYQKVKEEKRRHEKHKTQLRIINKMLSGDLPVNEEIVSRFMQTDENEN